MRRTVMRSTVMRSTVMSIGLSPWMSFTAAMIRPGRLVKEQHRHKGYLQHPEMYVIQTGGSSSGLSHDQHLYKKQN